MPTVLLTMPLNNIISAFYLPWQLRLPNLLNTYNDTVLVSYLNAASNLDVMVFTAYLTTSTGSNDRANAYD